MSRFTQSPASGPHIDLPVLIVGGGGAGLTSSMLLSQLGVEHLLVNSLPTTSILPKAHVLNQRTMEIFEDVGVASEIYERSTRPENMVAMGWYAGFKGEDPDTGRPIGRIECWGAGYTDVAWMRASPCRVANLPQLRLEPILKAAADRMAPGNIRFHHELLTLTQDATGVNACIRNRDDGTEYTVRAKYLLGCDGGRTIARQIGVQYEGMGVVAETSTAHITADLSKIARDPDVLIRWIWCPEIAEMAVLVPMGPDRWGPDSEEWVFHVTHRGAGSKGLTDEQVESNMRRALGIGDMPVKVHKVTRWALEGVLASKFRVGRVFLLGDAAHRHPPTGGLGLTSATHDAQNLCWKLAAVLRGEAGDSLLDSYEAERRAVDARNIQRSLENSMAHMEVGEAFGLRSDATPDANWAQLRRIWSGRPEDESHRDAALRAIRNLTQESNELNVDFGYRYASNAVLPDGTPELQSVDDVRIYEPSARPGSPLPHAWIDDHDGRRRPLKNLVVPGRFLLIAGEDGEDWCAAARSIAMEARLPIDAVRIGHIDGDLFDPRLAWTQCRGIGRAGAVLVRPDRFIAWRRATGSENAAADLAAALGRILGRELSPTSGAAA